MRHTNICRLVQLIPMCSTWEPYQKVSQIFERKGLQKITRKNKFCCADVYRRSGEHVLLLRIVLRNKDRLQNSIITVNLRWHLFRRFCNYPREMGREIRDLRNESYQ